MNSPPPPELLEQLGIYPCSARDHGAEPSQREQPINGTISKENLVRDIATATLSGNLTRDVELRTLPSGADVARMRLASTARRRNGEEWVEKTNYFTVEAYGPQARACAEHLQRGSRVIVDAELDWREWTDQQNNKREAVTFRARRIVFDGKRDHKVGPRETPDPGGAGEAAAAEAAVRPPATRGDGSAGDDDLPF